MKSRRTWVPAKSQTTTSRVRMTSWLTWSQSWSTTKTETSSTDWASRVERVAKCQSRVKTQNFLNKRGNQRPIIGMAQLPIRKTQTTKSQTNLMTRRRKKKNLTLGRGRRVQALTYSGKTMHWTNCFKGTTAASKAARSKHSTSSKKKITKMQT